MKNLPSIWKKRTKGWTGDLDGMIERRVMRILTVYSKTFYFVHKGIQRGTTYDIFRLFEADLNKKLAKDQKLKQQHLKVRVVFIPVARGHLLQALAAGKGDIAASNLTVTEERRKLVDFSSPLYRNVSEVVVSGPASPAITSVDELAGKEVFGRKSSSYYESLGCKLLDKVGVGDLVPASPGAVGRRWAESVCKVSWQL